MSTATCIEPGLIDRVASLIREIEQVEQARPPAEIEIQTALDGLDAALARGEAASALWLSPSPAFATTTFETSLLAILMAIEPGKVRKVIADRAKVRASAWQGLRMTEVDRERKLVRLRADLKTARARVELARRTIETQTGDTLPRVGDDPSVWLMMDRPLAELATGNGRTPR